MSNNKKEKLVRKPSPFLYWIVCFFFQLYIKIHFNLHHKGDKPQGPALILSNHTSNHDYKFIAASHWPRRITFVSTYHWFTFKKLRFWLERMGVIPKYQFAPDMASMRKIRYALDNNKALVFIAPEGTIYSSGRLGYISPSIAKTIKVFKTAVYSSKIEGAGLGNAKWSTYSHRGRVDVTTKLIITKEESQSLTVDEIMSRIVDSLEFDDYEYQKEKNVLIKGANRAERIDTMYYKCPNCSSEFTISSTGNTIKCSNCNSEAILKEDFHFKWNANDPHLFDRYTSWYSWQLDEMKKEILKPDFSLQEEVEYAIDEPGVNNYKKIGRGTMTLNRNGWNYKGTANGIEIEDHDDIDNVFLATLKIGTHFELPFKNGHCRVFYPIKNGKTSMKWHLASRAMTELKSEGKI